MRFHQIHTKKEKKTNYIQIKEIEYN